MPKPLREPPPTSSLARLFDGTAASRALTQPPPDEHRAQIEPQNGRIQSPDDEVGTMPRAKPSRAALTEETSGTKREIVLSMSTDETFTRLIELYRRSTGTRLSGSHVVRAMLRGVSKCFEALEREAADIGRLKLPSNARGREGERNRFEDTIAEAIVNGIRSAAAYRRDD